MTIDLQQADLGLNDKSDLPLRYIASYFLKREYGRSRIVKRAFQAKWLISWLPVANIFGLFHLIDHNNVVR